MLTLPPHDERRTLVDMKERLSRVEIGKDAVQSGVEAAAATAGQVASILTAAVGDVTKAVGGLATELFEIRDAARHAASVADETDEVDQADEPGETDEPAESEDLRQPESQRTDSP